MKKFLTSTTFQTMVIALAGIFSWCGNTTSMFLGGQPECPKELLR